MKDVVFIVVDSLCFDYLGKRYNSQSATPFLDELKEKSVFATRCYSEGPYTEAGTKALLCGTDVLDDKGYMYRFDKSRYFITDVFKEKGYETYGILYPTCVFSQKTLQNVDHMYYTSGFMFDVLWSQKLMYYVGLYESRQITETDYADVIDLLQLIFDAWIGFERCDKNPENYELLSGIIDHYPWQEYAKILEEQQALFQKTPKDYIIDLFEKKEKHILNRIPCIDFQAMIKNKEIKEAFAQNLSFVKKYKRVQKQYNRRNAKIPAGTFRKIRRRIKEKGFNQYSFGEYLYKYQLVHRGKDLDTMQNDHRYKLLLSAHTQLKKVAEIMSETTEAPKFIIAHIEEPHYFTTFFSYDQSDLNLISEEIKYAEDFTNTVSKDYRGLLGYQLAARYVDREIQRLFTALQDAGKLENTLITIVADHGSSYNCEPLRARMVNNFHVENYHIPLFIVDQAPGAIIDKVCSSKDVIPTILDRLGLEKPKELTGDSIMTGTNEYSFVEYMGPGCPDMKKRPVWLAIRDSEYLVCYIGKLLDGFNEKNVTEIYDLQQDKDELNNIKSYRNEHIERMIALLQDRFTHIYENNKIWLTGQEGLK